MKNNQRFAGHMVSTFMMMLVIILVQYTLDVSGITRAYYQWWANWSGIDFVGMLDYMYNSTLYHVCAWLMVAAASCWFGIEARRTYDRWIA